MDPSNPSEPKSPPFSTPVLQFQDQERTCPYLPDKVALMPLIYPMSQLDGEEFDRYLAAGRRRSSSFLYHTACPQCAACKPTRIPVQEFLWTDSLKRVLRRGDRALRTEVGLPVADEARVSTFNLHRAVRSLGGPEDRDSLNDYEQGFIDSCCDTMELSFWDNDRFVGASIVDCGVESISAVYTYFDPSYSRFSPGTYSILKQIEFAVHNGKTYLYLGMYVEANAHLRYKGRFVPQERFHNLQWERVEQANEWSDRQGAYSPHAKEL